MEGLSQLHQTFKEELTLILLKLLHNTETKGALPNVFYEATITLTAKPHKDSTKRITDQFLQEYRSTNTQ